MALLTICALFLSLCVCGQSTSGQSTSAGQTTWQEQYDLGVRYLSEGNYEEAIIAFTAAMEIDPKQVLAYVGRGDAYVLSSETEENMSAAQTDYERAIELDETNAEAYMGLADIYIWRGNYDRALEILRQALEKLGSNPKIEDKVTRIERPIQIARLDLSNVRYTYSTTGATAQFNDGAIGEMDIDYTVNGPSSVRDVLICTWQEMPFSQEQIDAAIEMYTAIWKQEGSIGNLEIEKSGPFDWGGAHPVYPEDQGTVQHVLLIGLDAFGNAVGYEIVGKEIP